MDIYDLIEFERVVNADPLIHAILVEGRMRGVHMERTLRALVVALKQQKDQYAAVIEELYFKAPSLAVTGELTSLLSKHFSAGLTGEAHDTNTRSNP